ncbi:thioredoxin reductase [Clostridia bacterium]|nr:thioredoxin reductase [Clostridia bacterium]
MTETDIAIIGGGAAGLSAAIYAARAGFIPCLFENVYMGGQIANTDIIENYPAMGIISGYDLIEGFISHLKKFEYNLRNAEIFEISPEKVIKTSKGDYKAKAVIIATGARPRKLEVAGEESGGVSYCAVCDGNFYRKKTVAVIGGGNTAIHDALFLSRICEKVCLIHRRGEFRGNIAPLRELPNVALVTDTILTSINGGKKVSSITIQNVQTKEVRDIQADGVFAAVGTLPNTEFIRNLGITDGNGAIVTDECMRTSISGIFAAGDVRRTPLRQIITAAADGAVAATYACAGIEG